MCACVTVLNTHIETHTHTHTHIYKCIYIDICIYYNKLQGKIMINWLKTLVKTKECLIPKTEQT